MGKVLIAYFSLSGNTEKMAEYITSSYIPILWFVHRAVPVVVKA